MKIYAFHQILIIKKIISLSVEIRQKLIAAKPETVGMAGRISGVTPAAISLLLVYLKKNYKL